MVQHDDSARLRHMLESACWVRQWAGNQTRDNFDADRLVQSAIIHEIQVIGEAAAKVSKATRAAHPNIPWPKIVAMRHIIVHEYMGVDLNVVWKVASEYVPELAKELERIIGPSMF